MAFTLTILKNYKINYKNYKIIKNKSINYLYSFISFMPLRACINEFLCDGRVCISVYIIYIDAYAFLCVVYVTSI